MAQSSQRRLSSRISKKKTDSFETTIKEESVLTKSVRKSEDVNVIIDNFVDGMDKTRHFEIKQNISKVRFKKNVLDDIGKWHPTDDLVLILSVQQCNDLTFVHRCIQFTRPFTLQEIQERWYQLLYNQAVSRHAQDTIRELPMEIINKAQENVLWSENEELILSAIPIQEETNNLVYFQALLDKFRHIFYPFRTALSLKNHYNSMKVYGLLNDQTYESVYKRSLASIYASKIRQKQGKVDDLPLMDDKKVIETNLDVEKWLRTITATVNENYAKSENRANHLNSIAPQNFNVLAELKGHYTTFLMKNNEVLIGRSTSINYVDFDLSLDGPCHQISNAQAILRYDCQEKSFIIKNIGSYDIIVDGKTVIKGQEIQLDDSSHIKFGKLFFEFSKSVILDTM